MCLGEERYIIFIQNWINRIVCFILHPKLKTKIMGCDIHSFAEVKRNGKWEVVKNCFTLSDFDKKYSKTEKGDEPFENRDYSVFGFLADVRNYSHCECITGSPRGLPDDSEYLNELIRSDYSDSKQLRSRKVDLENDYDSHSLSYVTLAELLAFDYDKTFWNRRISRTTYNASGGSHTNGAAIAEEGEGETITYREHLGEWFFTHIEDLKAIGEPENVRVVFWFDN